MRKLFIVIFILLGIYWLFDHFAPLPLNHESLGLYAHNIHRIIGVICLVIAVVLMFWKRKPTNQM